MAEMKNPIVVMKCNVKEVTQKLEYKEMGNDRKDEKRRWFRRQNISVMDVSKREIR